jgi:RNA polymerase sigma factor (sigma-70 family)
MTRKSKAKPLKNKKNARSRRKKQTAAELLRAERRPGPAGSNELGSGDKTLSDAARVLKLIASGALTNDEKSKNDADDIPRDLHGKPLRRLTSEDEAALAHNIQHHGDLDARNTLILANIGLVHLIANQLRRPYIRYEDLVQEGIMGLMRATETFEPSRNIRFSTYSVYWIRAKIQRFLQKLDRDDIPKIAGAELIEDESGRRKRPRAHKVSIDAKIDSEDGRNVQDFLASKNDGPEDHFLRFEQDKRIHKVLREIARETGDPRLFTIIKWRLLTEEPETLTELGERLNLSREGARLLENKILKLAKVRLKDFKKQTA